MADLTADATESNRDTLWRELQKVLMEIFHDGEDGEGNDCCETEVVKGIDEAIRILNCLKKMESKKPEFAPVKVPEEFICTLSNTIMIEPVVIASGQTYEKRYITEWLKHERICPKSKEVLSHSFWIPNHLINQLITQWCRINNVVRQKPSDETVTQLFTRDLEPLLQGISSSSSVADQTKAAKELRFLTKKYANVRFFFVSGITDSITRMLSPLYTFGEGVDSNPELQENLVTALFNLSILENNKRVIAENSLVIPLLTKYLKQGTTETRRNAAATFSSLSAIESNRIIIGNSETIKALIDLIEEGDMLARKEAISSVFKLCIYLENKEKVVTEGRLIPVATKRIKEVTNVDELLSLLALVSTHKGAIEEMDKLEFIYDLFNILREDSCLVNSENAVVIVYSICNRRRDWSILKVIADEEKEHGTFTKLVGSGSVRAVRKAEGILQWIKRFVTGKEPQRK